MRVSKAHPVCGWLRVDGATYSRALDQVLRDRDEQLKYQPNASGLPPASQERFWEEELPKLCCNPGIADQVSARMDELAAKEAALDEVVQRAAREVEAQRDEINRELFCLRQCFRRDP